MVSLPYHREIFEHARSNNTSAAVVFSEEAGNGVSINAALIPFSPSLLALGDYC